ELEEARGALHRIDPGRVDGHGLARPERPDLDEGGERGGERDDGEDREDREPESVRGAEGGTEIAFEGVGEDPREPPEERWRRERERANAGEERDGRDRFAALRDL